jgi:hypothetical protein
MSDAFRPSFNLSLGSLRSLRAAHAGDPSVDLFLFPDVEDDEGHGNDPEQQQRIR